MVKSLDALYPQEDPSTYPTPPVAGPLVTLDAKDVSRLINQKLTRAVAPGLDGWTRELLCPLTRDKQLMTELTTVLTDMANGNVPPEVAHRMRATSLTVLRKKTKKFRPIGAECVWAKAISLLAVQAVMPALKERFKNLQFGVGNNIELAIEKVRRDFLFKGSVAMLDGRNAYNAISRTAILKATYGDATWKPLWAVSRLLLGAPGMVGFYENGKMVHSWKSTRGVRQGMVLGPVLFSIGTLAALRRLQRSFPNAAFTAYLDDVTVAAPPDLLGDVVAATTREMERLGIEINTDKTEVLDPSGFCEEQGQGNGPIVQGNRGIPVFQEHAMEAPKRLGPPSADVFAAHPCAGTHAREREMVRRSCDGGARVHRGGADHQTRARHRSTADPDGRVRFETAS
ncbi:Reverse transcriptase domain [Trypanosoma melophagium]|uniref:Reverse transcriptase domain n=1 Tax=Trypanosoma melophagium TaxID=715481 RepID=UPI00351A3928|nr:Reverse transcriptase domain [Trypanosoma melophagium]